MMRIVITGSDGFFGSRFIDFYKDKFDIISLNHTVLDITDEDMVLSTVGKYCPQYLIHAAAISDTNLCEQNSEISYLVNVKGSENIAKACLANNVKLICLSSDQVYNGNIEQGPYVENCATPNTVYGKHKLEAENSIMNITKNAVVLRLTWLFGLPEQNKKTNLNILTNIMKAINEDKAIQFPLYEFRGITYVYDLIENFSKIVELPNGVYNTGSENNLSTYEVAKMIFEELGLTDKIDELLIKDDELYKTSPRDLRVNTNKLKDFNIYFSSTGDRIRQGILFPMKLIL